MKTERVHMKRGTREREVYGRNVNHPYLQKQLTKVFSFKTESEQVFRLERFVFNYIYFDSNQFILICPIAQTSSTIGLYRQNKCVPVHHGTQSKLFDEHIILLFHLYLFVALKNHQPADYNLAMLTMYEIIHTYMHTYILFGEIVFDV